jgi:hypothetical protein
MNKLPISHKAEEVNRSPVSSRVNPMITNKHQGSLANAKTLSIVQVHARQTPPAKAQAVRQKSMLQKGESKASVSRSSTAKTNSHSGKVVSEAVRAAAAMSKPEKKKKVRKNSKVGLNPYLELLLDPFNAPSAKIVDDQCYPSATFKIVRRISMSVNAQGIAGVVMGNYIPLSANNGGSLVPIQYAPDTGETYVAYDWIVGQLTGAGATATSLFGQQLDYSDAVRLVQWDSRDEGVPSLFTNVRLVSAGLSCHFNGTPLDAKGRITAVSTPQDSYWEEKTGSSSAAIDELLELPGAISCPVNQLKGAISLYKPVDYSSFDYTNIRDGSIYEVVSMESSQALVPNYAGGFKPGVLCLVIDGAEPGASVTFTFVAHYEGLPRTSTLNLVDAVTSPNDPLELAQTLNVVQRTPSTLGNADAAINTLREVETIRSRYLTLQSSRNKEQHWIK